MRSKEIRKLALDRLCDGKSIAKIASFLEVTEQTVRNWTKKEPIYGVGRVCRVDKMRLSPEQEEKVLRFVAERPGVFQADIVKYVSETFAVEITRFTASRILRRKCHHAKKGHASQHPVSRRAWHAVSRRDEVCIQSTDCLYR